MKQIIESTDNQFIGLVFDPTQPIVLDEVLFVPDEIQALSETVTRYSNSSYVIEAKEI
jgi:hypothetical protein